MSAVDVRDLPIRSSGKVGHWRSYRLPGRAWQPVLCWRLLGLLYSNGYQSRQSSVISVRLMPRLAARAGTSMPCSIKV